MTVLAWIGGIWCLVMALRVARLIWLALRENRDGASGRHAALHEWKIDDGRKSTTTEL